MNIRGGGPRAIGTSLTYDAQRGLAAVTEALEHRVAHETDQHIVVSFRTRRVVSRRVSRISGTGDLDDGIGRARLRHGWLEGREEDQRPEERRV